MFQLYIHRDMKHTRSLESTQEARVAVGQLYHLSFSPNSLRASYMYLDECTLMHEPIVISDW